jgi:hypothetical protein
MSSLCMTSPTSTVGNFYSGRRSLCLHPHIYYCCWWRFGVQGEQCAGTHRQIRHTPQFSGLSRWLLWQLSAQCELRFHLHISGIFSMFVTFSRKTYCFQLFGDVHWKPLQRKIKLLSRPVKAFHQNPFRWELLDVSFANYVLSRYIATLTQFQVAVNVSEKRYIPSHTHSK